jgi:hypothetical protein
MKDKLKAETNCVLRTKLFFEAMYFGFVSKWGSPRLGSRVITEAEREGFLIPGVKAKREDGCSCVLSWGLSVKTTKHRHFGSQQTRTENAEVLLLWIQAQGD